MQIFYLSNRLTILLFVLMWFLFQAGAALICYRLDDRRLKRETWLTKSRSWEKDGTFYVKYLKVRLWKGYLPDGSAVAGNGYRKRHLKDYSADNLERFIMESRRAEYTHWLAMLPFWIFGLFADVIVIPIMLIYALIVNLPCIIAQRYNRPRIELLLNKKYKVNHKYQMEGEEKCYLEKP